MWFEYKGTQVVVCSILGVVCSILGVVYSTHRNMYVALQETNKHPIFEANILQTLTLTSSPPVMFGGD